MNKCHSNTELSSLEGTRCQFNGGRCAIKLGIDVHQDFYVVVEQMGGTNPKPPQRFGKQAFLHWATKLKQSGAEVHAVYEACGFGFSLQRQLSALGIVCHVVCPQKLDERNKRVKTDGLDAKALWLKLDRFVQGNRAALAIVRVPTEEEERSRAIHRQREQLVGARKRLEAQGRSLMVKFASSRPLTMRRPPACCLQRTCWATFARRQCVLSRPPRWRRSWPRCRDRAELILELCGAGISEAKVLRLLQSC